MRPRFGHRHVSGDGEQEEDGQEGHTDPEKEMALRLWKKHVWDTAAMYHHDTFFFYLWAAKVLSKLM